MKLNQLLSALVNAIILFSLPFYFLTVGSDTMVDKDTFFILVVIYSAISLLNGFRFHKLNKDLSLLQTSVSASFEILFLMLLSIILFFLGTLWGMAINPDDASAGQKIGFLLTWPVIYFLGFVFSISSAIAYKGLSNAFWRKR